VRAQLGNDIAIKAYREGTLPFPDGAIIAALHWNEVASDENNKVLVSAPSIAAFADPQSSVAGSAVNVQFMGQRLEKVRGDGWLGVRRLHQRQTWRRGAA
jgi:Cytochrome P460